MKLNIKIKNFILDKLCCRFFIPYFFMQLLNGRITHNAIIASNSLKGYYGNEKIFEDLMKLKPGYPVYILLKGRSGDFAIYYLIMRFIILYLQKNNYKIFLIGDKQFEIILKLYNKHFLNLNYVFLSSQVVGLGTFNTIKNVLKLNIQNFLDFNYLFDDCTNRFYGDDKIQYSYHNYMTFVGEYLKQKLGIKHFVVKNFSIKLGYPFNDELYLKYKNKGGKFIICNFESRSFKIMRNDAIKFEDYLCKIFDISRRTGLKFIINSVYDGVNNYMDENIMIAKLDFGEIIWLAENNLIDLFISERNGLNDVFCVFYPNIKQIIYYPDYYHISVDKNIYNKIYGIPNKKIDVIEFWRVSGKINRLRKEYFKTVEKDLMSLINKKGNSIY